MTKVEFRIVGLPFKIEVVYFANSKDKNLCTIFMSYFEVIHDIRGIDYVTFRVSVSSVNG